MLWGRSNYQQPFVIEGARDPSPRPTASFGSLVELTNAYAFAEQNGLPLPTGLVALRPTGNSRDGAKIGAFKFTRWNEPALASFFPSTSNQAPSSSWLRAWRAPGAHIGRSFTGR